MSKHIIGTIIQNTQSVQNIEIRTYIVETKTKDLDYNSLDLNKLSIVDALNNNIIYYNGSKILWNDIKNIIQNNSITLDKLWTNEASIGKVLMYDGENIIWSEQTWNNSGNSIIYDNSIWLKKISTYGANAEQILKFNGTNIEWSTLTIPNEQFLKWTGITMLDNTYDYLQCEIENKFINVNKPKFFFINNFNSDSTCFILSMNKNLTRLFSIEYYKYNNVNPEDNTGDYVNFKIGNT